VSELERAWQTVVELTNIDRRNPHSSALVHGGDVWRALSDVSFAMLDLLRMVDRTGGCPVCGGDVLRGDHTGHPCVCPPGPTRRVMT